MLADATFRETYARAVTARDAAYRASLEQARQAKQDAQTRQAQRAAEDRKALLSERLTQNTLARRARKPNPVKEGLERAKRYYEQGMQMYEAKDFVRAASMFQLAMGLDEANETYRQTYERVKTKANQTKSDIYWGRGQTQESIGRDREAAVLFLRAVEAYPRADYCAHTAAILLKLGTDTHRAVDLASLASEADPQNIDYLMLLGQLYESAELYKKALTTFERALTLAPNDEEIKKAIKGLKKK
ncbi:hypothetical protein KKF91_04425 [Myxococcota bacterium]|nr:hypothetical protein [Myxococcota bacterium]MBU1429792.1 hypothetical protein [Myxococcota bacterium]MBU1897683.1 hypothetical protein [Myxococcota bacterium]